jgi:hypothetical protein
MIIAGRQGRRRESPMPLELLDRSRASVRTFRAAAAGHEHRSRAAAATATARSAGGGDLTILVPSCRVRWPPAVRGWCRVFPRDGKRREASGGGVACKAGYSRLRRRSPLLMCVVFALVFRAPGLGRSLRRFIFV